MPANADASYFYRSGLSQLVFRVTEPVLRRVATALIGGLPGRNIEFPVSANAEDKNQQLFQRLIYFFVSEIERNPTIPDLIVTELEQALILSFLIANQNNYSSLMNGETKSATLQQVSVVEEYIDANWDRPIRIEDIASATGTGVRNLFATFKKARGYTPMTFLRRARLEHARLMLQKPDAQTSVTGVSLRCGFQNASHFARHYKEMFGELPGATLAVGKRVH